MAISVPQAKSSAAGQSVATVSISFTSLPAAGSSAIVLAEMCSSGGVSSLSDNQGNTYSQVIQELDGVNGANSAAVAIYWCPVIGTPGGTFTVSVGLSNGTNSGWTALALLEVSGLAGSVGRTGVANDGGGGGLATGPLVITASGFNGFANALVVGGCALRSGTGGSSDFSAGPTSGYTSLTVYNGNTQGPGTTGGYKTVSVDETSKMTTPTWTGTVSCAGALATFKGLVQPAPLIGQIMT